MVIKSLFHYLLCDTYSLEMYHRGMPVTLDDVKRHLMLLDREENVRIPDHYYRLNQEQTFKGISSLSEALTKGLGFLAENYLEIREGKIYSRVEKQNEWQLTLPAIPPLILIAAKLEKEYGYSLVPDERMNFLHDYICPNVHYTALPSPYIRQLEDLRERRKGLHDLHIHLNGSLETDNTWQDFLSIPDDIYKELVDAFKNNKTRELYKQLCSFLREPLDFRRLMDVAFRLREEIYEQVMEGKNDCRDFTQCLNTILADGQVIASRRHPMTSLLGDRIGGMEMECLFYVEVLQRLKLKPSDYIANLFHFYLLILGLSNRLLVQQTQCNGFEEFQKYTLNGMREASEKKYTRRFLQMAGNELKNIRFVEGRFAPKDVYEKSERLLFNIEEGWDKLIDRIKYIKRIEDKEQCGSPYLPDGWKPELRLIAHFIKAADLHPDEFIRYKSLRLSLRKRAEILIEMKLHDNPCAKHVVGIDAAASEFDTPPEVFAPVFHQLRSAGFRYFTYHAGEDFFHVLSGLRAIYEAVVFLDLQRGDRIGHATACGVSVQLWRDNIGERMLVRQGEYLDDLIFVYHLISKSEDGLNLKYLPKLTDRIYKLSYEIYGRYYPVHVLVQAWLQRKEDPLTKDRENCLDEMDELFFSYHRRSIAERYYRIIEIDTYEILGETELHEVQLAVLRELHDREIVIESLPTSNVIIGHHHSFATYHLYNWWKWSKEGHPVPPIVIGTDDVGIFATNIYNEYCNIYCLLFYGKKMGAVDIVRFIEELDYNSRLYRFGG